MSISNFLKKKVFYSNWFGFVVDFFCFAFILLFVYTGASKISEFESFRRAIHAQPIAGWLQWMVIYTVPPVELLISLLIIVPKTRLLGVCGFTLMMTLFTGYTGLIKLNYYGRQPCSCGGVFNNFTWGEHLSVNIAFLVAGSIAILWMGKVQGGRHLSRGQMYFA